VAAAIEQNHDEKGILWPKPITPFHAVVLPIGQDESVTKTAEDLYADLTAAGADVLLDDRELRPGPKFKDADLIGVPLRVTVGERNLKVGNVEVYHRWDDRTDVVPVEEAVRVVLEYYGDVR